MRAVRAVLLVAERQAVAQVCHLFRVRLQDGPEECARAHARQRNKPATACQILLTKKILLKLLQFFNLLKYQFPSQLLTLFFATALHTSDLHTLTSQHSMFVPYVRLINLTRHSHPALHATVELIDDTTQV